MKRLLALTVLVLACVNIVAANSNADAQSASLSLTSARANFRTKILRDLRDTDPPDVPPPGRFDLTSYPSSVGNLAAYLTRDPHDGKKQPAVVWGTVDLGESAAISLKICLWTTSNLRKPSMLPDLSS